MVGVPKPDCRWETAVLEPGPLSCCSSGHQLILLQILGHSQSTLGYRHCYKLVTSPARSQDSCELSKLFQKPNLFSLLPTSYTLHPDSSLQLQPKLILCQPAHSPSSACARLPAIQLCSINTLVPWPLLPPPSLLLSPPTRSLPWRMFYAWRKVLSSLLNVDRAHLPLPNPWQIVSYQNPPVTWM